MRIKPIIHFFISLLVGAVTGFLLWTAYWHIKIIPDDAWAMVVSSSMFRFIHESSPSLDVPLLIIINALPLSLIFGLVAGCLLKQFKFQRVFSYAIFCWPLIYFLLAYYVTHTIDKVGTISTTVLWHSLHGQLFNATAVYTWFFVGLYIGVTIINKYTLKEHEELKVPD